MDVDKNLSPIKRAFLALEQAQQKIAALEQHHTEPVAIVGMACRFPGGSNTPEAFWQLLLEGRDAVSELPPGRWDADAYYSPEPATPGKMYTCRGGFLREPIDTFDSQVFGISPREAGGIDPQQRLLLELAWEALENAAQQQDRSCASPTGVFIGITAHDYGDLLHRGDLNQVGMYTITGTSNNAAAGRIAYTLGLSGPCMAIDTACSSSLVALHVARSALLNDECRSALVGGVNLMLSPMATIALSQGGVLARDGLCRAFDKAASGMVRGEGGAMLLLKRLSHALEDGDTIQALIRSTAVNQDGPSSGLTVPYGPAQEALIRTALAKAGLSAEEIDYIEAHGTGTSLGDPIELGALGRVFGPDRSRPLLLGSVKTNIGHLEASSGLAGVMKTVLSLQHRYIPPHLNFTEPTPLVPWDELPFEIPVTGRPWPTGSRPRLAGVSSFGFSGVNAHVIVEEAPVPRPAPPGSRPLHLLALSARSETALHDLAARYLDHLERHPGVTLADVSHSANAGRIHAGHRLAVLATSSSDAAAQLAAFRSDSHTSSILRHDVESPPRVAFLFTGQGAQHADMGRELFETLPLFRQILEQCDQILRPWLRRPLLEVLYPQPGDDSPLHQTAYTQPALFAIEYALARVWISWGVRPSLLLGHSLGEYVAACLAGVFTLEDALKLVAQRGALMQALPEDGAMAAVHADAAFVELAIAPFAGQVSIAAYNGPQNVVISGRRAAVDALLGQWRDREIKARPLEISHAFHSALVEPILDPFEVLFRDVRLSEPQIRVVSNLDGLTQTNMGTSTYWRNHLRQPVRFDAGLRTVLERGCTACIEVGPRPTLLGMARQVQDGDDMLWLPSLRPGVSDWRVMLESLGMLYCHGQAVDWASVDRDLSPRRIPLPTYPFQRRKYGWEIPSWASAGQPGTVLFGVAGTPGTDKHPLLGSRLDLPDSQDIRYVSHIRLADLPYLRDHRVFGAVVLPAAAYLEIAAAAASHLFDQAPYCLEDVVFHHPLPLDTSARMDLVLTPEENGAFTFAIHSRGDADSSWRRHVTGRIRQSPTDGSVPVLATLQAQLREPVDVAEIYAQCSARGIEFGADFRSMRKLWTTGRSALGEVSLPAGLRHTGYQLHPVLLDGALQVMGAVFRDRAGLDTYLPIAVDRGTFAGPAETTVWSHVEIRPLEGSASLSMDVTLLTAENRLVAKLEGVHLARVAPEQLRLRDAPDSSAAPGRAGAPPDGDALSGLAPDAWLYQVEWPVMPTPAVEGLPDSSILRAALLASPSATALTRTGLEDYGAVVAQTEALSVDYILEAFRELGWRPSSGDRFTADGLAAELHIDDRHRRLFVRLLEILAEAGRLQRDGERWRVAAVSREPVPGADELMRRYPVALAELTLLHRCGRQLATVLSGQCNPLSLLFPASEPITAATLYGETPAARAANDAVRDVVASFLQSVPADRSIRILEIGAGTGGTTSMLLPLLPPARVEYTFTDVSPLFVNQAAEKFSAYPFVRYAVLDIEQLPGGQGFAPHGFDLIVAANVLHATARLAMTLRHAHSLLAPGGLLILLEGTAPLRFIDLTFGLLEGWWRFDDLTLRANHPLLPVSRWKSLLEDSGFAWIGDVSAPPESGGLWSKQAILVARALPTGICAGQRWLIVNSRQQQIGEGLKARIEAAGGSAAVQSPSVAPGDEGRAFYRTLVGPGQDSQEQSFTHVAFLPGLDAPPAVSLTPELLDRALQEGCSSLVALLNVALETNPPTALWLATCQAQAVTEGDGLEGLAQAPLWGLSRVIALEYPDLVCKRIDLESLDDASEVLFDRIVLPSPEDQIAVRQGRRHVPRLTRTPTGNPRPMPIRSDGSYLITGGLSGLGLETAGWLIERGARTLVLTGRRAPGLEVEARLNQWRGEGTRIEVVRADVSNADDMAALLAGIRAGSHPLRGVIHSAGQLDDGILVQQDLERFRRVFAAKVQGAWHLHRLTGEDPLDFFVLYSSMATLLGSAGQGNHAAANGFLDMLAHHRRRLGLPGLSINWGAWSGTGAAAGQERSARILTRGMGMIAPREGLAILARLLDEGATQTGVAPIDWDTLSTFAARQIPFFSRLVLPDRPSSRAPGKLGSRGPDRSELSGLPKALRERRLSGFLRSQVAEVLRLAEGDVELRFPLNRLGLDSLMAVELRNRLRSRLDVDLPLTSFLEDNSILDLAGKLAAMLTPGPRLEQAPAAQAQPDSGAPASSAALDPESLLDRLDELSEEQLDALLKQELVTSTGERR